MNRRTALSIPILALAAVVVAGCGLVTNGGTIHVGNAPYTVGSGQVTTQARDVAPFHAAAASRGVSVRLRQGTAVSVKVTIDDNLQPQVTTVVADGILTITIEGSLETHSPLLVEATTPEVLDSIEAEAGTTIEATDLDAGSIAMAATSGSTIRASGRGTVLSLSAGSGSTADLRDFQVVSARVAIDSGSTASVTVSGVIGGTCTAGSTLHVFGHTNTVSVESDSGSTVRAE